MKVSFILLIWFCSESFKYFVCQFCWRCRPLKESTSQHVTVLGGGILCCSAYAWEWRETFRGSIGWGTRTTLSLRAWAYQRGDSTFLKNKGLAEEKSERTMARRSWWPQVYPSRSSRRNFCICLSHCSVLHGNHPLLPGCRQRWMRRSRKILSKILCLKMYTWLLGSSKSSPCCDSANVEFF